MILYYLSLPFKIILNVLSSLQILIKKPKTLDIGNRLDCKTFNQFYYILNDIRDQRIQKIKRSFLQKQWGVTKYSDGVVKTKADASDLIYATLGALKDYELGTISYDFELALDGIIANNLTIKPLDPALTPFSFQPRPTLKSIDALAIISALSLHVKMGSTASKQLMDQLLWKNGYILLILFPNFKELEDLIVGYFILTETCTGFLQKLFKTMALLSGIGAFFHNLDFQLILVDKLLTERKKIA